MALNGPRYELTKKMSGIRATGTVPTTSAGGTGLRIGNNFERGEEIRAIATIKLQEAKLNNRHQMARKKKELVFLNKESARRAFEISGDSLRSHKGAHKGKRRLSPK